MPAILKLSDGRQVHVMENVSDLLERIPRNAAKRAVLHLTGIDRVGFGPGSENVLSKRYIMAEHVVEVMRA